MAEVAMYSYARSPASYFPAIPPGPSRAATSYMRATLDAPATALMGVVVDGKQPDRHAVSARCRVRHTVGLTNRWRLPEPLGSDLLGSAQAIKSMSRSYNKSLIKIITAESPKLSVNLDMSRPYKFRQYDDSVNDQHYPGTDRPMSKSPTQASTLCPRRLSPIGRFAPSTVKSISPRDMFIYHTKKSKIFAGPDYNLPKPDIYLKCMTLDWELHRAFLFKSETLKKLLDDAPDPKVKKYHRVQQVSQSSCHSTDSRLEPLEIAENVGESGGEVQQENLVKQSSPISPKAKNVTNLYLEIKDSWISKHALAVALGNMYHDDIDVDIDDVISVLAAASMFRFLSLQEGCAEIMLSNLSHHTVCAYHEASIRYNQKTVETACEHWLQLNLIPQLSGHIQLRDLTMDLLQKVTKSTRFFTFSEDSVYKMLTYWLFLQQKPHLQLMPSYGSVLAYFNSLPKYSAFLEREGSQEYAPLFAALKLHGILDMNQLQDMQMMNILHQKAIIEVLTQHYHALQGGGDMCTLKSFDIAAVRQGFIIDDEPHYHSEVFSLHGFHFELKAICDPVTDTYSFFMQRLKPSDPVLSFRQCERHTFSMRPDRSVNYSIRIQWQDDDREYHTYNTGVLSQKFGLSDSFSHSQVVQLESLVKPIYVTFSIMFPPS